MKKKIILALLIFIGANSFAYAYSDDVIYFKNGNILRGEIIEFVPNEFVRIKMSDGAILLFNTDEIDRLSKNEPYVATPIKEYQRIKTIKGYFGPSVGKTIPVGKFADTKCDGIGSGFQFSFINFGYNVSDDFGIAATIWGANSPIFNDYYKKGENWKDRKYVYLGIFAGPSAFLYKNDKFEWDLRTMFGFYTEEEPDTKTFLSSVLGTTFRYNINESIALLFISDYLFSLDVYKTDNHLSISFLELVPLIDSSFKQVYDTAACFYFWIKASRHKNENILKYF